LADYRGYLKFCAWVIVSGLTAAVVFSMIMQGMGNIVDYPAIISNLVFCILNVVIGVRVVLSSIDKSNSVFFSRMFGSLFVRILIMGAYVALGLAVFKFDDVNFVISLFIYYFLFLFLEIMYIVPNKEKIAKSSNSVSEN
jgi:hypothetical protein